MEADDRMEYLIAGEITKSCHEIWKIIKKLNQLDFNDNSMIGDFLMI